MSYIRVHREINNDVYLEVIYNIKDEYNYNKEMVALNLIIHDKSYDIYEKVKINAGNNGAFGFPIILYGQKLGCIVNCWKMENEYDLNNINIIIFRYQNDEGHINIQSIINNNIDKNNNENKYITADQIVNKIYSKFSGKIMNESYMGYGKSYIYLNIRHNYY